MTNPKMLEKELRLRKLFTELIRKKGYEKEIHGCDLSTLFDIKRKISLCEIHDLWAKHLSRSECRNEHTYLYVHIPFCRTHCSYCAYRKEIYARKSQLDDYVQFLISEIKSFEKLFRGVQFSSLYIGGGSPNLLTKEQLASLLQVINDSFSFDSRAERTYEGNPRDFSTAKMKVLEDLGINRVSFGVQSLDNKVLQNVNRGYQSYEMIKDTVQNIHKFPSIERIDTDLLIGLRDDTPETVLKSFAGLAELDVDSICIFPLKPTPYYLQKYFDGDRVLFDQQLNDKLRGFEKLVMPVAEHFGYGCTPLDYSAPDNFSWDFVRKSYLLSDNKRISYVTDEVPCNCLGIGRDSWSMIANTVWYRNEGLLSSANERNYGEDTYQAFFFDAQRERFWYTYRRLGYMRRISRALYKKWFGTDLVDDFREVINKLEKLDAISITDEVILLKIKKPEEQFAFILFFIDNRTIISELEKLRHITKQTRRTPMGYSEKSRQKHDGLKACRQKSSILETNVKLI